MQFTIVLNPVAGNGRAGRKRAPLERALRRAGLDYALAETESPGHAVSLACEAACHGNAVVAVGGDGTARDVAEGLVRSGCDVPMGIVPAGTGNDFVRSLGIPRRLEAAVQVLLRARCKRIDYGKVRWTGAAGLREAVFLNAVGAGFDAAVARAAGAFKHLPGTAAYLAAVPGVLQQWSPPVVWAHDGEQVVYEGRLFLATVANGVSSGGGFHLTPYASVADGRLDLCLVSALSRKRVLQLLPRALRGTHVHAPEVVMRRLQSLTVESEIPLPVHVDGEVVAMDAVRLAVEVVPGGLSVLVPAGTI